MFKGFAVRDVMTTSSISYTVYPSPGIRARNVRRNTSEKKLDLIAKKKKIQAGRNRSPESVVADIEKSNSDLENNVDFSALKSLYPSFLPS
jgi:hypothetical protein